MSSAKKAKNKSKIWKKTKKLRKIVRKKIFPYFKCFFITVAVIEICNVLFLDNIYAWVKSHVKIDCNITVSVTAIIVATARFLYLIYKTASSNSQPVSDEPKDSTMLQKVGELLLKFIRIAKADTVIWPIIVLMFMGTISVYAAHEHMYGRIIGAVLDFGKKIIYYDEDTPESDVQETDNFEQDDRYDLNSSNIPSNLIERERPVDTDDTPAISESPVQFLTDPNRHLVMTESDESELFFLEGKYAIDYTIGLESAIDSISNYINDLRLNSEDSNFDDEAPPNVQRQIAYASELEVEMSNSEQLDEVIYIRQLVWDDGYRKYSIAWTSANNMQYYAQQYLEIDGNYDTIKYYYYRSIAWCWDALCFKETNKKTIQTTIRYLMMRYHDIMDIAPNNSADKLRAEIIYKALYKIENSMSLN